MCGQFRQLVHLPEHRRPRCHPPLQPEQLLRVLRHFFPPAQLGNPDAQKLRAAFILRRKLPQRHARHCGSIAVREPESFAEWLAEFGGGKLILGADIRDGAVAVQGWTERSEMTAQELIARFAPQGLAQVICTDIARDGMLCGTSAEFYAGLQGQFPGVEITVSGGIASMTDIEALDGAGLRSVIVGKALYEGRITLEELKRCLPNA